MDWFKQNPFLGALAVVTTLLVAATGYFLWGALGSYNAATAAFTENKAALESLQAMKPFPNAENADKAKAELGEAQRVLTDIAKSVQVTLPEIAPSAFQLELSNIVNELKSAAKDANVTLDENFYLGFNEYEKKQPSDAAAPKLALQMQSIKKIISILIDERVEKIGNIAREPLAIESGGAQKQNHARTVPELALAPFNVNFTANQTAFHRAFNRILDMNPPVFIRLVGITNSAPSSPSKTAEAAPAHQEEGEGKEDAPNKPVFGREVLEVNLGLASIAATSAQPEQK